MDNGDDQSDLEEFPGVRSENTNLKVPVTFENFTGRTIDILWISFNSKLISYGHLDPENGFMIDTYKNHPWIFRDKKTGERMQVFHEDIFWPKPVENDPPPPDRINVPIHFPLRSLRENCFWKLLEGLNDEREVDSLEIPRSLKSEIKSLKQF